MCDVILFVCCVAMIVRKIIKENYSLAFLARWACLLSACHAIYWSDIASCGHRPETVLLSKDQVDLYRKHTL